MTRPTSPLRAVLFDLGGVLIDWDPRHLYRKIFADEAVMEEFLATVCTSEWNAEQDSGRSWADAVKALSAQHPDHHDNIGAYHERWPEMIKGEIAATVAILAELRTRRVPLYALTNWSAETFPVAEQRFPFLEWFDGILVSGKERIRKPDPAIFELAIARFGLTPESTLFIDDVERNTTAAAALGFQTHHFIAAESLRARLLAAGALSG